MALWQAGDPGAAQTRLRRLTVNVHKFVAAPALSSLISAIAPPLESAAQTLPEAELAGRFADFEAAIAALPAPDFDAQADAALRIAGHDHRRDIRSRERIRVGVRPAIDFTTVTRSTKAYRKRIVVIDNDGYLLAIDLGVLGHEAHLGEFDQIVRTLNLEAAAS